MATLASGDRTGYALLAVLWICAGIAALGMAISAAAKDAMTSSLNRIALAQAEWTAHGCLARARARLTRAESGGLDGLAVSSGDAWLPPDSILAMEAPDAFGECTMTARSVGARLDVNSADEGLLSRVLGHAGLAPASADSIAAALADWKDADTVPRALGAERGWYEGRGMFPPADGPFSDPREIGLVRGMTSVHWEDLLDVERGAIALNRAPAPILAALPGFTPRAVARALELQRNGGLRHFKDIADGLAPRAADEFMDALPRLAPLVTIEPTAWIVRAEASTGTPTVTVVVEIRLERSGPYGRVTRQRVWSR